MLFQPHRYTRTRDLLNEFYTSFADADKVVLMDIYPAGEEPIQDISSELLLTGMNNASRNAELMKEKSEILDYLGGELRDGDMLLTLGAGDVWKLGNEFLEMKRAKGSA